MKRCILFCLSVLAISLGNSVLVADAAAAAQLYRLIDVTPAGQPSSTSSEANGINDHGQVVGSFLNNNSPPTHAFLYSDGTTSDLGTLTPGQLAIPLAINDDGLAVGFSSSPGYGYDHAFLYENGMMHDLGTLPNGDSPPNYGGSYAYDVNSSGQVVGWSFTTGGVQRGFVYNDGAMTAIGTLGGAHSQANAINDSGQVVGYATTASGHVRAILYNNGSLTNLGTLPGAEAEVSVATDINDSGQIVGKAGDAAFLYSAGTMTGLGLSVPVIPVEPEINDAGQIVYGKYLYDAGTWTDLNSLLNSSGAGWTISEATDINNSGWITARALASTGRTRGVLLMPVPEPSSAALAIVGVLALSGFGHLWRGRGLR